MLIVKDIHGDKVVLSDVEITVVWFYMTGMSMEEISNITGMKQRSISYFKRKVMQKIGADNNNDMILWYISQRNCLYLTNVEGSILRCFDKRGGEEPD